jgi:DNA-binding CsgD family transcriptional regulator/PAS domain-containing protein
MKNSSHNSAPVTRAVAMTPITEAQSRPAIDTPRVRGPICDDAELSALIGDIYDTTMDAALWPGALRKIGDFTGGMAICLHTWDASDRRWYACGRTDPEFDRLFLDEYYKINPLGGRFNAAEVGRLVGIADVMDLDEYRASRFCCEWSRPQGVTDIKILWLDKSSATTNAALVAYQYEGNAFSDEEIRRRALLIGQHLRRAAVVGRALEHKTVEAAALADTFDGLRAAVLLVDADARVVHANASGAAMLRKGFALRTVSGRFAAVDSRASATLLGAIAAAKGGDMVLGRSRGIAVILTDREGERYVAHVLPLTSAERRGVQARRAVAALVVQKAALELGPLPPAIAETFGLTPTELRVLRAIVETGGVPEAADALGIGQATLKTHLHRLFGKTDTRRQADLVKLVAGFASPLAG